MIANAAKFIRPLGIFLTMLGFYFLFAPVIALLSWIPLVGWLLGGIVALAAAIFAFVVGGVIAMLTIAVAWVFFRPLFGLLLLAGVGVGVYFIFFFGKGIPVDEDAADADDTPTPTPAITAAQIGSAGVQLLAQKLSEIAGNM
mmetsp:Transcript_20677/g.27904  ORF Transcript_20677/g.27904 Transcript_20677/m.27904 type:complete len:143 (-) Transcript_20677:187-615(-)